METPWLGCRMWLSWLEGRLVSLTEWAITGDVALLPTVIADNGPWEILLHIAQVHWHWTILLLWSSWWWGSPIGGWRDVAIGSFSSFCQDGCLSDVVWTLQQHLGFDVLTEAFNELMKDGVVIQGAISQLQLKCLEGRSIAGHGIMVA